MTLRHVLLIVSVLHVHAGFSMWLLHSDQLPGGSVPCQLPEQLQLQWPLQEHLLKPADVQGIDLEGFSPLHQCKHNICKPSDNRRTKKKAKTLLHSVPAVSNQASALSELGTSWLFAAKS